MKVQVEEVESENKKEVAREVLREGGQHSDLGRLLKVALHRGQQALWLRL